MEEIVVLEMERGETWNQLYIAFTIVRGRQALNHYASDYILFSMATILF